MRDNTWVLFDLDGTLTQSEEGIWNGVKYTADLMGFPQPDADTLRKCIGPPLLSSFQQYLGMTPEQATRAMTVYRERYTRLGMYENRVYPGVRFLLRTLKSQGAHLGVVTGKPEGPTRGILAYFGLDHFMETVVCTADNRAEKEHLIRQALPADHGEVWMVGDRCFDMEGGVRAGAHTLGAAWGYGSANELWSSGAQLVASSPREAAALLCPDAPAPKGAFLSMEGLDGSGKGTQLELLTESLARFGFEVVRSREPGGSPIGEKIRDILLDRHNMEMTPETEMLLYAAGRAQHVREVIRPAVEAGKVLLCDRFVDSSIAYQGGGRQLGVAEVTAVNAPAVDGMLPDATVYLSLDHRQALERRCAASVPDRMEIEAEAFHARVETAFLQLIDREPDRFVVVDASRSREEIAKDVWERVFCRLLALETETGTSATEG